MPRTEINLQFNEVVFNEGMDVGTLVGVLSATDADTDDLLRYELLAGEGDSGNHWFVLDANGSLFSSTIFDYETNATQYAIRARARWMRQMQVWKVTSR